jgi:hypothetical protein
MAYTTADVLMFRTDGTVTCPDGVVIAQDPTIAWGYAEPPDDPNYPPPGIMTLATIIAALLFDNPVGAINDWLQRLPPQAMASEQRWPLGFLCREAHLPLIGLVPAPLLGTPITGPPDTGGSFM